LPAPGCYQEEITLFICEKQRWTSGPCAFTVLSLRRELRVGELSSRKKPHGLRPLSNLPWVGAKQGSPCHTDKVTPQFSALRLGEFMLRLSWHNVRTSLSCNFTRKEAKDEIIFDDIKFFFENQSYSEMVGTFLY